MRTPVLLFACATLACAALPRGPQPAPTSGAPAGSSPTEHGGLVPRAERPPAPEFVLFDQSGQPFALAEHRSRWVVLHLYPRSDTPSCACDATVFTEHLWRFGSLDAEVACITSESPERVRVFAKKYGLGVPVLSDVSLEVARQCGAVDQARADPVVRTTLLVDPEGRVARRWDDVTSREHVEEILEALEVASAIPE